MECREPRLAPTAAWPACARCEAAAASGAPVEVAPRLGRLKAVLLRQRLVEQAQLQVLGVAAWRGRQAVAEAVAEVGALVQP